MAEKNKEIEEKKILESKKKIVGKKEPVKKSEPKKVVKKRVTATKAKKSNSRNDKVQIWVKKEKLAYEKELIRLQVELLKLQNHVKDKGLKILMIFEGRDAAGKGGTIKRITEHLNPRGARVVALEKPSEKESSQWYFQRYVTHLPAAGEMVLFDRSWYNRAMVESVFDFCTQKEYEDFMKGVKGFEKDLVRQGTILVKLYFSVTKAEQAKRFERRKTDPLRQWKLSEIDVQAQERWDDFTNTKYKMLKQTHSQSAPWTVVRSNDKQQARLEVLKVILNTVDYEERDSDLDYSLDPDVVISGAREIEIMEAQRTKNGKFIG